MYVALIDPCIYFANLGEKADMAVYYFCINLWSKHAFIKRWHTHNNSSIHKVLIYTLQCMIHQSTIIDVIVFLTLCSCSLNFIYWSVTLIVLSLALILGATSNDSTIYTTPVDYFRAVCEGLMLLLITTTAIRDILLIYV